MKLFHNANFITVDAEIPTAKAMAIDDNGTILEVGGEELIEKYPTSEQIDLQGNTVLPAFNDAHVHVWKVGHLKTFMLDLRGCRSIAEMQQKIKEFASKNPNNDWILARGINEFVLEDKRLPTKEDLDAVLPNKPIWLIRTCAHIGIANSKAIEISGINEQTPEPFGGEIRKNAEGKISGIFTETALCLITKNMPQITDVQYEKMILAAQETFLELGITSATDPGVTPDILEVYKKIDSEGKLKIKINLFPLRIPDGATEPLPLPELYESDFLRIKTVKFFADGGLSSQTAAMDIPYLGTDYKGVLRLDFDTFYRAAFESCAKGFSVATHAIGHQAMDLVVDVYEKLFQDFPNISNRIEHVGFISERNLERMKRCNMKAVMQPIFIYELGENYRNSIDESLFESLFPFKLAIENGITTALSTDGPVVKEYNPWIGIQTALDRKDAQGFQIGAKEVLSLHQAIEGYTLGGAKADEQSHLKGSLAAGKQADFIVLNQNPFDTENVASIKNLQTFINGKMEFSAF